MGSSFRLDGTKDLRELVIEVAEVEFGLVDFVDKFLHDEPHSMAVHRDML